MRKHFAACVIITILLVQFAVRPCKGVGIPKITADAAVVLDARTGNVLYGKQIYQKRSPASTTKILTAVVALESCRLDDQVLVSKNASFTEGTSIYLSPGERVVLEELVWGALLESGNDACVAIAEHLAGNELGFSKLQNRKAVAVGAWDTHYVNSHGLTDDDHYTTAYDLANIARYALRNNKFQRIVRTKGKQPEKPHESMSFFNTNRLLWRYEGCDGVKTGTTMAAGQCLVASASRDQRQLVAVVLHSDDRYHDAAELLDYGFLSTELLKAVSMDQIKEYPLRAGLMSSLTVRPYSDLYVVVPNGQAAKVNVVWECRPDLQAPVSRGDVIGEITVWMGNELLGSTGIQAVKSVPSRSPFTIAIWNVFFK